MSQLATELQEVGLAARLLAVVNITRAVRTSRRWRHLHPQQMLDLRTTQYKRHH